MAFFDWMHLCETRRTQKEKTEIRLTWKETGTHSRNGAVEFCEVSGAGCTRVNGRYYPDGLYEGQPRYRHERDEEELYLRHGGVHFRGFGISPGREPVRGHWMYFCASSHNRADLLDVPDAAEWVTHGGFGGLDPAPLVSVHRKAPPRVIASSCLVMGAGCSRMNGRYCLDGEYRGQPRYKHELEDDLYLRQGGKYCSGYGITAGREAIQGHWAYFCVASYNQADLSGVPDNATWVTHGGFGATNPPPQVMVQFEADIDMPGCIGGVATRIEFGRDSATSSTRSPSMDDNCEHQLPLEREDAMLDETSPSSVSSPCFKTTSTASTVLPLQEQQPLKLDCTMPVSPLPSSSSSPLSKVVATMLPRIKRAVSPPLLRRWRTRQRDSLNRHRGISAPATARISPDSVAQCRPCSKCDGPHEDSACPHFPLPREKHKDAWVIPSKSGLTTCEDDLLIVRFARVIPQPGIDGSCLFHSLAYGLGSRLSGWVLRQEICTFIANNPHVRIADNTLGEWVMYEADMSVDAYAEHILDGAWGGGIEMAVFSEIKQVNVHVYEWTPGGFQRISAFNHPSAQNTVTVLYQGRGHYDAIVLERC
mmetsp:Transcript_161030/g.294109  ORF Transcript_161030/g.294109 Transcript_161030/m.294109 type:complete len:592 (-) Transcript_161030:8-1783(-)